MRLIELPFAYTYLSRLKNYRGLVGYITREWIPLIVTLQIFYSAKWWLSSIMFMGFLSVYECGYLVNDLARTAEERGGNRVDRLQINVVPFWFSHMFVFAAVVGILFLLRGRLFAMSFAGLGMLVLGILLFHSSRWTRSVPFLRIFTFAVLAVYKFAPVVIPQVPFADGQSLLMAVFLCYGFARVIVYGLRKFGDSGSQTTVERFFGLFECIALMTFGPILFASRWESPRAQAVTLIWGLYCAVAASLLGLHLLRMKFLKQAEQLF